MTKKKELKSEQHGFIKNQRNRGGQNSPIQPIRNKKL